MVHVVLCLNANKVLCQTVLQYATCLLANSVTSIYREVDFVVVNRNFVR